MMKHLAPPKKRHKSENQETKPSRDQCDQCDQSSTEIDASEIENEISLPPPQQLDPSVEEVNECKLCGFNPMEFSKSIPNFREKLKHWTHYSDELENWRGSLSSYGICFRCAH